LHASGAIKTLFSMLTASSEVLVKLHPDNSGLESENGIEGDEFGQQR
jgi:hypothetical protein